MRYRCNRCKYVYDPAAGDPQAGVPAGTPFSALPENWSCPISGAPKGEFRELFDRAEKAEKPEPAEKPAEKPVAKPAAKPAAAPVVVPDGATARKAWTVGSLKASK
jgi:rubredoxin